MAYLAVDKVLNSTDVDSLVLVKKYFANFDEAKYEGLLYLPEY